jgi:hypothetical protein
MPPRFLTPLDPSAPNVAGGTIRVARLLRVELLPWQVQLARLAGELDPTTGRMRYEQVVVIVPRRAGKSLTALANLLRVMMSGRGRRGWYTAHRREVGAALWRDEWFPLVDASPFASVVECRRSNGSEALTVRRLASTVRLFAPDGQALRSQNADAVVVDEAREFTVDAGALLEGAVAPAQALPRRRQRWIVSNAGGLHSSWLAQKRDAAVAALEAGERTRTAFYEWSAPPDVDDTDPAVWADAHPRIGHGLELDALAADLELIGADRFRIEYLGIWPTLDTTSPLAVAWSAGERPAVALTDPVWFSVELDTDRMWSCIVAGGWSRDEPGRVALELIDRRPHGPWLLPRLGQLIADHDPAGVVYDRGGPLASDAAGLGDLETTVIEARTDLVAASAGTFHDRVLAGQVTHPVDETLTLAVTAGQRRPAGGSTVYRRTSAAVVDVGPLIAASLVVGQLFAPNRPPEVR